MSRLWVCMAIVLCLVIISSAFAERNDEEQAKKHYRVALEALKNNDLESAAEELYKAAELVPKNTLILYNLAVVQAKQGKVQKGLSNVERALELGLPEKEKEAAEELEAKLTFEAKKQTEVLRTLVGKWGYNSKTDHPENVLFEIQCTANDNSIKDDSITLACIERHDNGTFSITQVIDGMADGKFQCRSFINERWGRPERFTLVNEDTFYCDPHDGVFEKTLFKRRR
jgi:tetratricopeptide (TPR) repeat protein